VYELCVSLVFLEHMGPLSRVAFCTRKVLLMCDLHCDGSCCRTQLCYFVFVRYSCLFMASVCSTTRITTFFN
jgi:hypothetical protein